MTRVVAVVPAKDRGDSVGATVTALRGLGRLDEVVVVDDGSTDDTAARAAEAGARVVRLATNVGKGGAVTAGVQAAPEADVYLLIDADVAGTAAVADALLAPVLDGRADMTVGVLPAAGARGGFGKVRGMAAAGIRRACGFEARAPLSGQRAVRGEVLRSLLPLADRFGLEVGLTIDAVRAGARVEELDVPMEHRHTGRTVAGFRHRGRQGVDIVRALWPRLTSSAQRMAAIALLFVVLAGVAVWQGSRWEPSSVPPTKRPSKVLLYGVPRLALTDLGSGATPTLDRMRSEGAVAALFVRTLSRLPSASEGYATLGAGTRVAVESPAGYVTERPEGGLAVQGADALADENADRHVSSVPGAFGAALRDAGRRAAFVGFPDAAVAVMDKEGIVPGGTVGPPPARFAAAVGAALSDADVVMADPMGPRTSPSEGVPFADRSLAEVLAFVDDDTLVLVFSVIPPDKEWLLAPVVAWGAGVHHGYLHSVSTRREGLVTLTDLAPTVLDALGVATPDGMVGRPLRYRPGAGDLAPLNEMNRISSFRQRTYVPLTTWYVTVQALAYLFAIFLFSRLGGARRAAPFLRLVVLAVSAWPLATFVLRAIPDAADWGGWAIALLLVIDAALVALSLRARRRPLSPLAWLAGATVAVILVDVWTGSRLQMSSILGYSMQTAGRFTGIGNTTFAVLAATTVLAVCLHVHHAPRRREALATAAGVCALVVMTDGLPSLGADVGGILSLVPVFALLLWALAGRRVSWKTLVVAGGAAVVALVGVAMVDYLRPVESRTHLGGFVADLRAEGLDPLWTTSARKVSANLRTVRSPWTATVPIITAYVLWMLVRAKGWQRLVPPGSALRAAALGVLAVGILGNVVNDSGIVVTAVVFVYLGPLLTLVALDRERRNAVEAAL